jgi:hypothetical protein
LSVVAAALVGFLALDRMPDDGPTGGYFHIGKALPW